MRKRALVTGSSSGIGRATVLELSKNGYDVGIHYAHSREKAEEVARESRSLGATARIFCADAMDTQALLGAVDGFVEVFGGIDLLVNNVGLTICQPFLETTAELFDTLVTSDLKSMYFATQTAAKAMIARNIRGCVINVTSVHQQTCILDSSVYGIVKAACAKFTQHAAVELAPYGIRVNAVAPGTIQNEPDKPMSERLKYLESRIPVGRLGLCEDVARAIAFLAGAPFVDGANLLVDGGAMAPSFIDNYYTPYVPTDKLRQGGST